MKHTIKKHWIAFIIFILLSILNSISMMGFAYVFGKIVEVAVETNFNWFLIYSAIGILIIALKTPCSYYKNILKIYLNKKHNMYLRSNYYNKVLTEDYNSDLETSSFINFSTSKIVQLENKYFLNNLELVSYSFTLLFAMVFTIYYSWIVFLFTVLVSIIVFLFPFLWKKSTQNKVKKTLKKNEQYLQISKDAPKSYWKYWTLNKVSNLKNDLKKSANEYETQNQKSQSFIELQTQLTYLIIGIIQVGLISITSFFLLKGSITIATVTALSQVTSNYIQTFNAGLSLLIQSLGHKTLEKEYNRIEQKSIKYNEVENLLSLEIVGLNFNYGEKSILKDVNIKIKKGDKLLITGPSGIGKSTLLKQIFNPKNLIDEANSKTQYFLNNEKVDNFDIRNNAVYIDQDVFLMNDTIFNNIKLSNPDITESKLDELSEILNLDNLIKSLPEKWNTVIKDNMSNLSGGERQRIAILLGLASNKKWYFLDEINSAPDKDTSYKILKFLSSNPENTLLMVSHNIDKENKQNFNIQLKL